MDCKMISTMEILRKRMKLNGIMLLKTHRDPRNMLLIIKLRMRLSWSAGPKLEEL